MASKGQKFMKLSSKTKKELLKINYQSRLWLKQFRAVKSADDVNYRQLKSYKKGFSYFEGGVIFMSPPLF